MCQVVLTIGKLRQSWTENLLQQHFSFQQSRGKRDREFNFVHALRDRDNLEKILERKVDLATQGEKEAQQKLYHAEAEIEAKNWEKRNRDHSFQEINQKFESQRFRLNQASQWADQAQTEREGERELVCMEKWN